MPKYTVIVTRDITESTCVTVEADNHDAAEDAALVALSGATDTNWEVDDGSWDINDPYVTDVTDAARGVDERFAHSPNNCPSNHWNRGDDICEDCGLNLNE